VWLSATHDRHGGVIENLVVLARRVEFRQLSDGQLYTHAAYVVAPHPPVKDWKSNIVRDRKRLDVPTFRLVFQVQTAGVF
jgi:hypothetical protein